MVTASHNPKEYTGMKIVRRGALPVGGDSGLLDVRDRAAPAVPATRPQGGQVERGGRLAGLRRARCSRSWTWTGSSRCGSSSTRPTGWRARCSRPCSSGCRSTPSRCFFEPDGTFPNHEPNPLLPENREFIVAKTREEDADLGRRLRRRRRPLLLRRRHRRVRPRRLRHRAARGVLAKQGRAAMCSTTSAPAGPSPRRSRRRAARRSSTASGTRSSSTGCARRTPSSPARSPPTTTSATSRRPIPASSRSCSCSS